MDREQIAALMSRRTEAFNRHDIQGLAALYSADCTVESPLAAGTVQGRQAVTKIYLALFEAFPDMTFTPEELLIDGDRVAVSATLTGTYTGTFMGLDPSGKPIRVPLVTVARVADGQIVSERRTYDLTGMLVQVGVLKARPA